MSRARNLAVAGAMLVPAAIFAKEIMSLEHAGRVIFIATVIAGAGIGMTRRSLVVQIVSRALGWLVLLPSAAVTIATLGEREHLLWQTAAAAVAAGAALLLSRPLLHTDEARRQFAPKAFRSWFLAGSTALTSAGIVATLSMLFSIGESWVGLGFGALAVAMIASAIAVLRMRAWGVLLGAATSLTLLVAALFLPGELRFALLAYALPSLLLQVLPVMIARSRPEALRVDLGEPTRYRIAEPELDPFELEPAVAVQRQAMTVTSVGQRGS